MQAQTDNDTPAEDLHGIFVVIFVAEFEQAEEKIEISVRLLPWNVINVFSLRNYRRLNVIPKLF